MTAHYDPTLLGVLNVSPESMVVESIARSEAEILNRAELLSKAGAKIIDVGGRSITPDAPMVRDEEEQARVLPAIELLKGRGYLVSVDTWSPHTAIEALACGVDLVNFTGATLPGALFGALSSARAGLIITYMPYGDAYRMRNAAPVRYSLGGILAYLGPRVREAREAGVESVVVDPNVGIIHPVTDDYAKIQLQLDVLWNLAELRALDCPILLYAARKPERLARIMMASLVLRARPEYIRTHHPEMLDRLIHAAAS